MSLMTDIDNSFHGEKCWKRFPPPAFPQRADLMSPSISVPDRRSTLGMTQNPLASPTSSNASVLDEEDEERILAALTLPGSATGETLADPIMLLTDYGAGETMADPMMQLSHDYGDSMADSAPVLQLDRPEDHILPTRPRPPVGSGYEYGAVVGEHGEQDIIYEAVDS